MRKQYDIIIFDLDGTITESGLGITNSIRYSLNYFGIDKDRESLERHIGPSLSTTFREYLGDDEEQIELAIKKYREYYVDKGLFENVVYEGVEDVLKELKKQNKTVLLASSKPKLYCEQILKHFDLDKYFDFIGGSNLDETRTDKKEVITYSLENINSSDTNKALMIGDREYDVLGSKALGIDSVGVLYGYGNYEELEKAGANYIIEKIDDLLEIISLGDEIKVNI